MARPQAARTANVSERLAPHSHSLAWALNGATAHQPEPATGTGRRKWARAALQVAVAWGYVEAQQVADGDALLDRVAAMLHRLGARR